MKNGGLKILAFRYHSIFWENKLTFIQLTSYFENWFYGLLITAVMAMLPTEQLLSILK